MSELRRVWHLGADIDTDALAPGAWMHFGVEVIAQHCLENHLKDFSTQVRAGDLIVAGPNFGIGSSREQAAAALVHLGVAAVIAQSWGGLFFRNAFNLGLLLLTCDNVQTLRQYDRLQLDEQQCALSLPDGTPVPLRPVPHFLLDMVRQGGLMAALRARLNSPSTFLPLTTESAP
jgi:3-isopropylmalate/(R)-2-methylmalate dehydratase small subunit